MREVRGYMILEVLIGLALVMSSLVVLIEFELNNQDLGNSEKRDDFVLNLYRYGAWVEVEIEKRKGNEGYYWIRPFGGEMPFEVSRTRFSDQEIQVRVKYTRDEGLELLKG